MKLKKKIKRRLFIVLIVVLLLLAGFLAYKSFKPKQKEVKEKKVVSSIEKYGYSLKEGKPKQYKEYFKELEEVLKKEEIDETEYVSKLTELFIYDFYSLDDKEAKTDVGGVEFIYPGVLDNFLLNAQNTYYKYVESNIYNNRQQNLPMVDKVEVTNVEQTVFGYNGQNDEKAYKVSATWTYTSTSFNNYQKNATLVWIHEDPKLSLVELQ